MRILFLAHRLPYPPNKGEKIRSFFELRTLAKNHDLDLFCFYDDAQDKHHIEDLRRFCRSCYVEPISAFGSRVKALCRLVQGQPFSTGFFYSEIMAKRIAETVRSRSYDLIFVFGSSMAQYAEPWPNLPRILDLVDVDSDKWEQYASRTRGLRSWLWQLEGRRLAGYEARLVSSFSNTLVCTSAEARLLRSIAPMGRISVLQNWLDTDYYQPETVPLSEQITALQPYIVFTGSMDYFPNVDAVQFFCREVLPGIRSQVPWLRFVIAGRNASAEVMRLGSSPAIHVTGTVPDIRPYLRGAAAAVAPMRIARGVQNKILEALAMGLPVVASSVAASALPDELAALLMVEDEPALLGARLIESLRDSQEQLTARRMSVVRYTRSLDLPAQLEYFLGAAVAEHTKTHVSGAKRDEDLVPQPC
jgi:sugar transferase (PEP-CTERM/EpsH1 system associated)